MDAVNAEAQDERVPMTDLAARATLEAIVAQCDHALKDRLAKRFSTRDALKSLSARAGALLGEPTTPEWGGEVSKVIETANATFDLLIAEVEPAGHA